MSRVSQEKKRIWKIRLARLLFPTDKAISKYHYRHALGHNPNIEHPVLFTEKIQWIKFHATTDLMRTCSDKLTARDYVGGIVGKEALIPLIAVYDDARAIDWGSLPSRFVLQCNHDCKSTIIVKDKAAITELEKKDIEGFLSLRLKQDYSKAGGETQYRGLPRRILATELLENPDGSEVMDYKFYCFHGEPRFIQVDVDRHSDHRRIILDCSWEKTGYVSMIFPKCTEVPPKPAALKELVAIASRLSKDFPFVRVDLYECGGKAYFGELTFTPANGAEPYQTRKMDEDIGKMLNLGIKQ